MDKPLKPNIVGSIIPSQNAPAPEDAEFCVVTTDGAPCLYYRIKTGKYNTGEEYQVLMYMSTCGGGDYLNNNRGWGGWMASGERDYQAFLDKPKFYAIKN